MFYAAVGCYCCCGCECRCCGFISSSYHPPHNIAFLYVSLVFVCFSANAKPVLSLYFKLYVLLLLRYNSRLFFRSFVLLCFVVSGFCAVHINTARQIGWTAPSVSRAFIEAQNKTKTASPTTTAITGVFALLFYNRLHLQRIIILKWPFFGLRCGPISLSPSLWASHPYRIITIERFIQFLIQNQKRRTFNVDNATETRATSKSAFHCFTNTSAVCIVL